MKFEYKTTLREDGSIARCDQEWYTQCCEKASDCLDSGFIESDCDFDRLAVFVQDKGRLDDDGEYLTKWRIISFCPFCGAKIECEEVSRVKRVKRGASYCDEEIWRKQ